MLICMRIALQLRNIALSWPAGFARCSVWIKRFIWACGKGHPADRRPEDAAMVHAKIGTCGIQALT
jgi:hypothetical protein